MGVLQQNSFNTGIGGTDDLHRATIARSNSPSGPWIPNPENPILFNGAYGFDNLTVQSTGHATFVETPTGEWYAAFLARRKINGTSPLGRETFLTTVKWVDDWPILNDGNEILLSESFGTTADQMVPPPPFIDHFSKGALDPSWYQLRVPYTKNYNLAVSRCYNTNKAWCNANKSTKSGITLLPNVFGLSDRDVPAAILRKQKSLNMTFSATLLPTTESLGYLQSVGISAYLSEFEHQDIGIRGCINETRMCLYTSLIMNTTTLVKYILVFNPWLESNLCDIEP